jgi:hypothetical protein
MVHEATYFVEDGNLFTAAAPMASVLRHAANQLVV